MGLLLFPRSVQTLLPFLEQLFITFYGSETPHFPSSLTPRSNRIEKGSLSSTVKMKPIWTTWSALNLRESFQESLPKDFSLFLERSQHVERASRQERIFSRGLVPADIEPWFSCPLTSQNDKIKEEKSAAPEGDVMYLYSDIDCPFTVLHFKIMSNPEIETSPINYSVLLITQSQAWWQGRPEHQLLRHKKGPLDPYEDVGRQSIANFNLLQDKPEQQPASPTVARTRHSYTSRAVKGRFLKLLFGLCGMGFKQVLNLLTNKRDFASLFRLLSARTSGC